MAELTTLHVKIKAEDKENFENLCSEKYQVKHTDMIRTMVSAFNENRLTIIPSEGQSKLINDIYKGEVKND